MKKYMELILILFLIVLMLGCSKQDNTTPTGYPSGEIDQPQIMYENKVYYYFALALMKNCRTAILMPVWWGMSITGTRPLIILAGAGW